MNAVMLRYCPHNSNKIFQQRFEDVKLKAGTYIYKQHDRVKKICSILDKVIDAIKVIDRQPFDNLQIFEIVMVDPTQLQIMDMKQKLLRLGQDKFKQRIQLYSNYIQQMNGTIQRLDKKRKRYIKKQQKLRNQQNVV